MSWLPCLLRFAFFPDGGTPVSWVVCSSFLCFMQSNSCVLGSCSLLFALSHVADSCVVIDRLLAFLMSHAVGLSCPGGRLLEFCLFHSVGLLCPGCVCCGLLCRRRPDSCILGGCLLFRNVTCLGLLFAPVCFVLVGRTPVSGVVVCLLCPMLAPVFACALVGCLLGFSLSLYNCKLCGVFLLTFCVVG